MRAWSDIYKNFNGKGNKQRKLFSKYFMFSREVFKDLKNN